MKLDRGAVYFADRQGIHDRAEVIRNRRRNACVALVGRIAVHPRVSDTRRRVVVGTGIAVVIRLPGGIFVNAGQGYREVPFDRGVELVLGLDADGISRGVGFVVESGRGLERTVGLEGEEGIVAVPCPAHQGDKSEWLRHPDRWR